jgi:hypothetical protein
MNMQDAFQNLNWLSVAVAALSGFAIGSVWYSPLMFAKRWMKENNFTTESLKDSNFVKIYGLAFVLFLFASFNLAMFIGKDAGAGFGALAGFLAGLGWVFTMMGVTYLFEKKSLALLLINAGYSVIALTVMGLIIGLMQ